MLKENMLLTTKGVCDLYMHGTIESATANVHCAFDKALKDSLTMQDDIYKKWLQKVGILLNRQSHKKFKK